LFMNIIDKRGLSTYAVMAFVSLLITACSISKPALFYREAQRQQLQRNVIQAGKFSLVYYTRANEKAGTTLHVYLGGDGVPWHHLVQISDDPGPYSPLVLQLMKQDRVASIFLGRPCYQGLAKEPPCTNRYWTSARYSHEILDSMSAAIQQLMSSYKYKHLVLIGYSGGGTLAVLLARKLPQTRAVLTVAGNLDTDAWTDLHHYSRLTGSLNPARLSALPAAIRQIHIQGERDNNIPPGLADAYLRKQDQATVIKYPDADHSCCWQNHWSKILKFLN
jgi:pimeloyl-ACP methyl ester carboxylesterase